MHKRAEIRTTASTYTSASQHHHNNTNKTNNNRQVLCAGQNPVRAPIRLDVHRWRGAQEPHSPGIFQPALWLAPVSISLDVHGYTPGRQGRHRILAVWAMATGKETEPSNRVLHGAQRGSSVGCFTPLLWPSSTVASPKPRSPHTFLPLLPSYCFSSLLSRRPSPLSLRCRLLHCAAAILSGDSLWPKPCAILEAPTGTSARLMS